MGKSTTPPAAEAVEDTQTDPAARLVELGLEAELARTIVEAQGVETIDDLKQLTEIDLIAAGIKSIPARKLIASLQPVVAVPETVAVGAAVSFDDVLPMVPSDESWLNALKTGGVLKVDQSTVISAIRAALANRVGLYDIPGRLAALMEQFADANEDQVDPVFFELRRQLTRRSYAEVFEAINGLDGSFVTEARKKQLFDRMDSSLWPAIIAFHNQLKGWQEAWTAGAANPALMMMALTSASSGMVLPPGMMQPPDTGGLRDYADAVADAVNKVFAGTGVQIAAALAYDAAKIKDTLQDTRLPALIGAANREQMLKQLGVAVSATYPRLEQNLTRFVLATMQVKDQPGGDTELRYFSTMLMLGQQIGWEELSGSSTGRLSGIGGDRQL